VRPSIRPTAVVAAALVAAVFALALVARSQLDAQGRSAVVLATALETPGLAWAAERLTDAPEVQDLRIAGAPATLARPGGGERWPALVIVNGATALGRREPALQRLVRGLARAGFLCVLPDLPGLPDGRLGGETVAATVAVARATARREDVEGGRVGLVGVSVGTSLALLAAAEPSLAGAVSMVAGTAPYADLGNLLRLATTGYYRDGNLLVRYDSDPFLAVAAARSLAAVAPGLEGVRLTSLTSELDEDADDPLAPLRAIPTEAVAPEARPFVMLLANRDPRRFDELYGALPAQTRDAIEQLSPLTHVSRIRVPLELATASEDRYVPLAEVEALARAASDARVTVTDTLTHAVPRPSLGALGDLAHFNGWVVRSLRAATDPE
jgi:dienelactone hydrolase